MSKGPILQGDIAVPLRCVHKTEEQKKSVETPQIQKKLPPKKKNHQKKLGEFKKEKKEKKEIIFRSETFQAEFSNLRCFTILISNEIPFSKFHIRGGL